MNLFIVVTNFVHFLNSKLFSIADFVQMAAGLLSLFPDYIMERYQRTDGIWMGD